MLGELIKCNPEVFVLLNDILDDATYTAFMQVPLACLLSRYCSRHRRPLVRLRTNLVAYTVDLQVVVSNLVDSNVFLRAVILSLEFFSSRCSELQVHPRARIACLLVWYPLPVAFVEMNILPSDQRKRPG